MKKIEIKGINLSIIKAINGKLKGNIILNKENLNEFPLKSRIRQGSLFSLFLFYKNGALILARAVRQAKEIKIKYVVCKWRLWPF